VLLGLIYAFVNGIKSVYLNIFLVKTVLNDVSNERSYQEIISYLIISLVILSVAFLYESMWNNRIKPVYMQRISAEMQNSLFNTAIDVPLKAYEHTEYYEKFVLAIKNGSLATDVFDNQIKLISNASTVIAIIGLAITMDSSIVIVAFTSFFVSLKTNIKLAEKKAEFDGKLKLIDRKDEYIRRVFYLKEHRQDLRLYKLSKPLYKQTFENATERRSQIHFYGIIIGRLKFFNSFILEGLFIDFGLILYLSYKTLILGLLDIGTFMALINGCYSLKSSFNDIVTEFSKFYENGIYIERYRSFIDLKFFRNEAIKTEQCTNKQNTTTSEIDVKLVSPMGCEYNFQSLVLDSINYQYSGGFALKNISMEIKAGEKVAIVGYNGAGKSTLVKLITQLNMPNSGNIILNGNLCEKLPSKELKDMTYVLFQHASLYHTKLLDNITMGSEININKLDGVLYSEVINQLMVHLPMREYTEISKEFYLDGRDFSGGECQSIMLSRIFYHDKDLIILDEPNSALDVETEDNFYNFLLSEQKEKAMVFVSHRLSSVLKCDKIYMLENGSIIESGTHNDLMNLNEKYAELFRAQSSWY
jgi:ATP-binding cassette subfamily B protein